MKTLHPRGKSLVGYADQHSVAYGQPISFKVSADNVSSYHAEIVQLISGDLHPEGLGHIERQLDTDVTGEYPGRYQPLNAGSYAVVAGTDDLNTLESITVQAMVWPTNPGGREQTILSHWDADATRGFYLAVDVDGHLFFATGDGRDVSHLRIRSAIPARVWSFVAACYDASTRTIKLYQRTASSIAWKAALETAEHNATISPAHSTPIGIAALVPTKSSGRPVSGHYNGKIDRVRLSDRSQSLTEMDRLTETRHDFPGHVRAAWDFARDMGTDRIIDASTSRRHGTLVNMPTRAMKGYNWDGSELDWKVAPEQYGAIHFHDDDLYDAGWKTDFTFTPTTALRSGVYAAKLTGGGDIEYIPFVVRPRTGTRTADVVVLLPTASYLAYANERAGLEGGGRLHAYANHLVSFGPSDLWLNANPEVGGSMYDVHSDGSGVCYSSRLRPIVNFRPGITNSWIGSDGGAPWQFNADLPLIAWLEAKGIPYDVVTDEDLHYIGADLLAPYKVVLTGSHPEYYSQEMYVGLESFLGGGGRLMYLGGNGFYWRVAFHPTLPGVMELRRTEDGIRDWVAEGGEYYHSFTGEYGGMWSRIGRPISALAGVNMAAQGFDVSSFYRRTPASKDPRTAFIFAGIADEIIGDFGTVGGGAAGIELDRRDEHSPAHALVVASSEGHSDTYFPSPEHINNAHAAMDGTQNRDIRADMTFYETASGGAVFSTGSISWLGSLTHRQCQNNVSRVMENVLRRFVDPTPFPHPLTPN